MPFHRSTVKQYREALLNEMQLFPDSRSAEEVDSIYFGGGTPSLAPVGHVEGVLNKCRHKFRVYENCEVSLEGNPGTISSEKAAAFRRAGINRISLGAQSFEDRELSSIGRQHTAVTIFESLNHLRAHGFVNINLDLMLGLPQQTAKSWRRNLEAVARVSVPHISVYMLDLDDHCPLYTLIAHGSLQVPEEDLISDLYLETIDFLSSFGYLQYEISNFALSGFACRHNLKYWKREPVQGFGLGSHSFDGRSRQASCSAIGDYFQAIDSGRSPVAWREQLTDKQALEETLFLGLRLTEGVDWTQLRRGLYASFLPKHEDSLRELCSRGLVEWTDGRVRLTPPGMLVSNEIFQLFI